MSGNELRSAINSVVELLRSTQIQQAISHFRTALIRNEKSTAIDHLNAASQQLMAGYAHFGAAEKKVCGFMHLENLGSDKYWSEILSISHGLEQTRAEVVQLYSRVMFAANHLPGLVALLDTENGKDKALPRGRAYLEIRLLDAGEKASDLDRISRTIDGIDMVYSACVSLAKKPAVNLSLVSVTGDIGRHLVFEGDQDGVNAVRAVIESIADEVADLRDTDSFDPDSLVSDLPVFDDLATLQKLGTFRSPEVAQISESLHEGCLLIMESGVLLEPEQNKSTPGNKVIVLPVDRSVNNKPAAVEIATPEPLPTPDTSVAPLKSAEPIVTLKRTESPNKAGQVNTAASASTKTDGLSPDEFYRRYLKEKNRMQSSTDASPAEAAGNAKPVGAAGASKMDALNELISDLDRITRK